MRSDQNSNGSTGAKRKKPHRDITKDEHLTLRVVMATFHHEGQPSYRSHRAVARELGLTVPAVAALLEKGFEKGLFFPVITPPREQTEVARLESVLRLKYNLREVLLVPGYADIMEPLDRARRRSVHTAVIRAMAGRVAAHLDGVLQRAAFARKNLMLGVAWGRTMHLIAEHLLAYPRALRYPGLEVVPIVGITSESNPEPIEANVIAMDLARAWGGRSAQLPCSAFVPTLDEWVIMRSVQVRRMLKKILECDVVLTSMGPIPENEDAAADITLCAEKKLNEELFKSALSEEAIGEICYNLFDRHGNQVKTSYTPIGLGFEGLQRIARDPSRQVILVAGGDRWRFEPLRAALRARLASVLVSDTVTARYLAGEAGL